MIQNFKIPVIAEQLTDSELALTLTLLLRGNMRYEYGCAYATISLRKSATTLIEFEKICEDADIRMIQSQASSKYAMRDAARLQMKNLMLLLAKQQLIPRTTWKQELHIPYSWFYLSNTRLIILLDFAKRILVPGKAEASYILPSSDTLSRDLKALFRPVSNLEISVLGSKTVISFQDLDNDISDLL